MRYFPLILLVFGWIFPSCTGVEAQQPPARVFQRVTEANESAFSILIPQGWRYTGGIFRVDPSAQGGAAQSIAAKLDFSVQNDEAGTVAIRWLPDVLFFDARNSPAGQMGLYPPGSNYNGMTVWPLSSPQDFVAQIVIPYVHPGRTDIRLTDARRLPGLASGFQQRVNQSMPGMTFSYDAAAVQLDYMENGVAMQEIVVCIIENWGQLGAGMWGNKESFLVRAPAAEMASWEPVFSVIQQSVRLNPKWVIGEIQGQIRRGEIAAQTQAEIQAIEQGIVAHKQQTNAEIQNDVYLTLTGQEEYVNPFTKEVERGPNEWKNRWVNEQDWVIYSDSDSYNPNTDIRLNTGGFKRSQIRPR